MKSPEAERKLNDIRSRKTPYCLVRGGLALTITKDVYPTSELSELLVDVMDDPRWGIQPGATVLDYGTGTGFLAISAALRGATVIATDISGAAVQCAALNADAFGVRQAIDLRVGAELAPIRAGERFDAIYAGLPWDDEPAADMVERSLFDEGFAMRRALFRRGHELLRPGGHLVLSSVEGHREAYPEAYPPALNFTIAASRKIYGLDHFALVASFRKPDD